MTESFAELFEESISQSVMQPGKVIMAEVVDTSGDFAVVSAGLKSEALIPLTQFRNAIFSRNLNFIIPSNSEIFRLLIKYMIRNVEA